MLADCKLRRCKARLWFIRNKSIVLSQGRNEKRRMAGDRFRRSRRRARERVGKTIAKAEKGPDILIISRYELVVAEDFPPPVRTRVPWPAMSSISCPGDDEPTVGRSRLSSIAGAAVFAPCLTN